MTEREGRRRLTMGDWNRWIAIAALATACTPDTSTYSAPLCASDGRCAGVARCVAGFCVDPCADDAECPGTGVCRGMLCWSSASGSCSGDGDCAPGRICAAGTCAVLPLSSATIVPGPVGIRKPARRSRSLHMV